MKIIIVGAVAAGMSVAGRIARHGDGVSHVIYEKKTYSSLGACGIPFFVAGDVESSDQLLARTNEEHIENGINLKTRHEVIEIISKEKKVIVKDLDSGKEFKDSYDKLVMATGASPIIPPIPGINEYENIFTATTKEDADEIHKAARAGDIQKVVIVGGGFIGVEMAEALTELGKDVRIIEAADRPSSGSFDIEITNVLVEELKKHCHLHLKEKVEQFKGAGILKKVVTDKGEYDADMAIISVGFKPNTIIKCDAKFLRLENGAFVVNENMKTSVKNIYACGDCATINDRATREQIWVPLATGARKTGKHVANHILGITDRSFPGTLATSGFRFHNIELFRTGITTKHAEELKIPVEVTHLKLSDHADYVRNMQPLDGKIIVEKHTGRIIGAQFAGSNYAAALRCAALAGLMWNGVTDKELVNFDFMYTPPYSKPTDIIHLLANISIKNRIKK